MATRGSYEHNYVKKKLGGGASQKFWFYAIFFKKNDGFRQNESCARLLEFLHVQLHK